MNNDILTPKVQSFINTNLNTDIMSVLLKPSPFEEVSSRELAQQIESKNKCKEKLPIWYNSPNIYFPKKIHIEQTSSETTANYKAKLVKGKSLLDVTGGFGVDSYYFSQNVSKVYHCDLNKELSKITTHNFKIMALKNIETHATDGLQFIQNSEEPFDWIYIDPSRRDDHKGKVFLLSDCLPNVPENLDAIFKKTKQVLIKTSPLLDFSAGINELQFVKEIHVVSVKNEVKEILWVLEYGYQNDILIKTINLNKTDQESFDFSLKDEKLAFSSLSHPLKYLYEPNSAILKSGAFKSVGNQYSLYKLHEHSHLYTSNSLVEFPGRIFKIEQTLAFNKKEIQKLGLKKANITTRNFPQSVADIRKKFKIKDGGEQYLFFTTDKEGKYVVLQCTKTS
ncbi:class I SAM-dependent methyltransferase [Arenibacter sp. 6A1]|uniref:THUMP-like domain-containing protein n=1 Tax=Arenibacter sp. 6A1 TaxID=2720391 RepID=UPI0014460172|nr:class I SAM-dependent methyltransferase [Arenibacter sp. 6A1]NKI27070.1 class I SAM-dependent methyltransferase [Arenibacter sp. 6A1]